MNGTQKPSTMPMVKIPAPQFMEAPSSWLTRFALAQGESLRDVLDHLDIPANGDIDLKVARLGLQHLRTKLGSSIDAMAAPLQVLENLRRIDPLGKAFMLNARCVGQFSYCLPCLREQGVFYIPVHWRISTWRYCPLHMCLMETGCPHCGSRTALPVSLLTAGPKSEGVAFLRNCVHCDKPLSDGNTFYLRKDGRWLFSEFERHQLQNGRAALAALYSGKFFVEGSSFNHGLRGLLSYHRRGLLPSSRPWLQSHVLHQRQIFQGRQQ